MYKYEPSRIDVTGFGGRRMLDTAEGVLVGLRRCSPGNAFDEIVGAARRHGVPVFTIAAALIELAGGHRPGADHPGPAHLAAQREWGDLFAESAGDVPPQ